MLTAFQAMLYEPRERVSVKLWSLHPLVQVKVVSDGKQPQSQGTHNGRGCGTCTRSSDAFELHPACASLDDIGQACGR